MYPAVDTGVLEFIDRKKIEDGFSFTREQIREEARRISRENGLTDFKASIGWYNRFMSRNGLSTAVLNRGVPIANQPRTPPENQDQPGLDQANHPQGEPGALQQPSTEVEASQPEGETGAFEPVAEQQPSNENLVQVEASQPQGETGHDQSPDDSQNFQDVAMKTNDVLEQVLDMFSPVATQSLGSNQPFSWHSNPNEEGNEIVNQNSIDGEALINQLIT